jgi:hypothetical protein
VRVEEKCKGGNGIFPWVRKRNEEEQTGVETMPIGPIELYGQKCRRFIAT